MSAISSQATSNSSKRPCTLVVWFTGLSGSGKSTLAAWLQQELSGRGRQVVVLDGDEVREGLSADLGFSLSARSEHIRRVAEVAKLIVRSGVGVIVPCITPRRVDRLFARRIIESVGSEVTFVEVFVRTSLQVCERRDRKGLYARARRGEIMEFTGISSPFEAPDEADVVVDAGVLSVDEAGTVLIREIEPWLERSVTDAVTLGVGPQPLVRSGATTR